MNRVITIGLGYIGLPTSALIALNEIPVYGVDINQSIVDKVNNGEIHIVEPDLAEVVKKTVKNGLLKAGTEAIEGDVYLIVVPTPFKENFEPDISYIQDATEKLIPLLKEDDLYIIESTSPIGTTEKMRDLIYSCRPDLIGKLNIAYCPERVLPGNVLHELVYNDRVIGGIDHRSTEVAIQFYRGFVKGNLHPTNSRTAEMCKLTENASRDSQIAFANELSIICDEANIDVWELIKLANKHPRVNILSPGCGVGGHCIAVDPYFIAHQFREESKMIRVAREINNSKKDWSIQKIKNLISEFIAKNGKTPVVALCGLTFKPDIDDLRESPAFEIARYFKNESNISKTILLVEPNLKKLKNYELSQYKNVLHTSDIIVYLVGHKEFVENNRNDKNVIDLCGVLSK